MAEQGLRKWIITLTVIMASLLQLIDTTIVNVALPQIMGNLGATLEDAGWLITGYAVANVIILPMSGWLGDRFGRKNYFIRREKGSLFSIRNIFRSRHNFKQCYFWQI